MIIAIVVIPDTKISEVNLSTFIYRPFHEDFSPFVRTNTVLRPLTQKLKADFQSLYHLDS